MSLQTAPDINVLISVSTPSSTQSSTPTLATERRISPSWAISTLKSKLEPITGIPPSAQTIKFRDISGSWTTLLDHQYVSDYALRNRSLDYPNLSKAKGCGRLLLLGT